MSKECQILEAGKRTWYSASTRVGDDRICASSGRRGHTQPVTASLVLKEEQAYFPKVVPAAICRSVPAEKWNVDGDKLRRVEEVQYPQETGFNNLPD